MIDMKTSTELIKATDLMLTHLHVAVGESANDVGYGMSRELSDMYEEWLLLNGFVEDSSPEIPVCYSFFSRKQLHCGDEDVFVTRCPDGDSVWSYRQRSLHVI